ncbi:MAG: branched-chain amino acid ABC transporter permease [Firmicutes bacterium]|nr:branched-chain amino acid ABC transporter permease [Bacillota bacterium]
MQGALLQVLNGLTYAAFLFLLSAGLTLIFGVMRIVNFAHGSLAMLGAYVAFDAASRAGGDLWVGLAAAVAVMVPLGVLLEAGLLRPLQRRGDLYVILFTYGLVLVMGDLVKLLWGPEYKSLPRPGFLAGAAGLGPLLFPAYNLMLIAVAALVALVIALVLNRTAFGMRLRAVSADRETAEALGIHAAALGAWVFGLGVGLAALGGALVLPVLTVAPSFGVEVVVEAFIVVVVGGLGNVWGALLGSVLIGVSRAFGIALFPAFEQALIYAVMAAVLIVRPWGLLGRAPLERN